MATRSSPLKVFRVLALSADGYGLNRRSHQIKNNIHVLAFVVSINHDVRHNSCWLARQDNVSDVYPGTLGPGAL